MDPDKEEFYRQLAALRDFSDDEDQNDSEELREILRKNALSKKPISSISSSFPSSLPSSTRKTPEARRSQSQARTTPPSILRTTSAPTPGVSFVKETPQLQRKTSLLRFDITTPTAVPELLTADASVIKETPLTRRKGSLLRFDVSTPVAALEFSTINASVIKETPSVVEKSHPLRTVSTPVIGSVVMKHSSGIQNMMKKGPLSKKRKHGSKEIKLAAEEDRFFTGQTFFYVPNDKVAKVRRARIDELIKYGATWSTGWTMEITHVFAEKKFTYSEIMAYLAPIMKADTLPSSIILVNHTYSSDCIIFKRLVDPKQDQYVILPPKAEGVLAHDEDIEPQSNVSLQIKSSRPRKGVELPEEQTPPRSQPSTQNVGPTSLLESPGDISFQAREAAFDEIINYVAANWFDLPIDDDAMSSNSENEEEIGSSDEEDTTPQDVKRTKSNPGGRKSFNQENFSCMKGGTGGGTPNANPNSHTILILEEMAEHYILLGDPWRPRAYRAAVGILRKQTKKISTREEAIAFRGIGTSVADKIQEIVTTGELRKLDSIKLDPNNQALMIFNQIYGVGLSQASKWVEAGYRNLNDLKAANVTFTAKQQIGIDHYEDFKTRIPRDEVTALGEIVKTAAANIDREVGLMIMGSYRRGVDTSGDVDMLITRAGSTTSQDLLPFLLKLVKDLTKQGFLVAALAEPRHDGGSKWHGACRLSQENPTWRRIDLLLVPETEMGAALIYFTGDDIFNRSIRLLASKYNMRLNQRGLFANVMQGRNRVKLNEGILLEGADEMKIFELLGVPWRAPEQRICRQAKEIET